MIWILLVLFVNVAFATSPQTIPPQQQARETISPTDALNSLSLINRHNIKTTADFIFKEIKLESIEGGLGCKDKIGKENWLQWRDQLVCPDKPTQNPDIIRNRVVKNKAFQIVQQKVKDHFGVPGIGKTAIGTPGPRSDIDISIDCDHCDFRSEIKSIQVSLLAKIWYDLLFIHLFNTGPGTVFDTEVYVDTIPLIRKHYQTIRKDSQYRNLALTLSQVQCVRQLEHGIQMGGETFTLADYRKLWPKNFFPIIEDARVFNIANHPLDSDLSNIATYIPIISVLAQTFNPENEGDFHNFLVLGLITTYFPESYFTNEALIDVCYGLTKYSQLFKRLIEKKIKLLPQGEILTDIGEINAGLIETDRFIYLVSALENLGYFYHKLHSQKTPIDALSSAGKYYLRIVRALLNYWQFNPDNYKKQNKNILDPRQKRLYNLYQLSNDFERFKRKEIPITTFEDVKDILQQAVSAYGIKGVDTTKVSKQVFELFSGTYATQVYKQNQLDRLLANVYKTIGITFIDNLYQVNSSIQDPQKQSAASALCLLLNLIVGNDASDSASQEAIKAYTKNKLTKKIDEKNSLDNLTFKDLKAIVVDLTQLCAEALADLQRTERLKFEPVKLLDSQNSFIQTYRKSQKS